MSPLIRPHPSLNSKNRVVHRACAIDRGINFRGLAGARLADQQARHPLVASRSFSLGTAKNDAPASSGVDPDAKFDPAALAKDIVRARLTKTRLTVLPGQVPTVPQAYESLMLAEDELASKPEWKVVGFKIGATSQVVQQRLKLNEPFWGPIFRPNMHLTSEKPPNEPFRFSIKDDMIRGIEAEFAFTLGKDIPPRLKPYTQEELLDEYCESVSACVEVCASRLPVTAPLSGPFTICDLAGNGCLIFEKIASPTKTLSEQDKAGLAKKKTWVKIDGDVVAHGSGAEVMGSPAHALEWFVNKVVHGPLGVTLFSGSVVTTGATCGLIPISRPCYVAVEFGDDEHATDKSIVRMMFRN